MSERKEKKIRRLQRRIEELEGQNIMLRTMLQEDGKGHWLRKPYSENEVVGPDGKINCMVDTAYSGTAHSLAYSNLPLDAHYAPIPSGHKPGIFRRLKAWLLG